MGFALMLDKCYSCGHLTFFNPVHVPSVKDRDGKRRPLCFVCATALNKAKVNAGLDPMVIHQDSYIPCDENELV